MLTEKIVKKLNYGVSTVLWHIKCSWRTTEVNLMIKAGLYPRKLPLPIWLHLK